MNGVRNIAFPSTGPVYGEPTIFPTPAPNKNIALYGVFKIDRRGRRPIAQFSRWIARSSAADITFRRLS